MEIELIITMKNGRKFSFIQIAEKEKNNFELNLREDLPHWARLDFHQCKGCPLKSDKIKWCPVAVKLFDVANAFPELVPYEKVTLDYSINQSHYTDVLLSQDALVQVMLSTLAFSACPEVYADVWSWEYFNPKFNLKEILFRRLAIHLIGKHISSIKKKEFSSHLTNDETLLKLIEKLKPRINNAQELHNDHIQNALVVLKGVFSMVEDGYQDLILADFAKHLKEKQIVKRI